LFFIIEKKDSMKKILLPLLFFAGLAETACAQFSATLAGNPLVTTGWAIGGYGTVVDSTLRLTTSSTDENGYVYYDSAIDLTSCAQFSVKFDYQIIPPTGGAGVADGIAFFYISTPPSGFVVGGGLGLPTTLTGIVFTLDTWDNDGDLLNPESELFGYTTPSGYLEANRTQLITGINGHLNFMDDGTWHHCEIDYNAGNINVYYDYNPVAGMTGFFTIPIASGYFGFSAATGAGYSTQSVTNVHITANGISPVPAVSSPVVYCQYAAASPLTASGAGPFEWFTTDTATVTSLPSAPVPVTTSLDTTVYYVREGTGTCISPADSVKVIIAPLPGAPVITGDTVYCTGDTFVPFIVTGTGIIKWYDVPTGGAGTTVAPIADMSVAGSYTYYASETVNGCEGPRSSIHVVVHETPPVPPVSGPLVYCQYAAFVPLTATGTNVLWFTASTGGTGVISAPTITTAVSGTYTNYVQQSDSGCTSLRGPITVLVHPKPGSPSVNLPHQWCQFLTPGPLSATPGGSGDALLWYGPGATIGTSTAPTPSTLAAPDTIDYYVTETSSFGCVSDSALDAVVIIKQPAPPVTKNVAYCQQGSVSPLNASVDSAANSYLNWYFNGALLAGAPVPATDTFPGSTTWYVTQTVNTCESDSAAVSVTILYKPVFGINAAQPWVCQYDSISLAYNGPQLIAPGYSWTLPAGASFAAGTHVYDDSIVVTFDSTVVSNYVTLTVADDSGMCSSDTSIRILIESQPTAQAYTKPDVCIGDTVDLALSSSAANATDFTWYIDYLPMANSQALDSVSANTNSSGPYIISWIDSGLHVISVVSFSKDGCRSAPVYDTVNVHMSPDANFKITSTTQSGCIDDTVQFTADVADYSDAYVWSPAQSFENVNTPVAWGKIEEANTIITLTVTDPFGCTATQSMEIDPNSCCTVAMPNAFTPNGDGKDDFFRPLFNGYHHFHVFRIVNRWGQVVFNSENSGMEWDGRLNGAPQDMGTYYYFLEYDCGGKTIEQKGDVTLIR
jgi:gliding motility-associated-like protein